MSRFERERNYLEIAVVEIGHVDRGIMEHLCAELRRAFPGALSTCLDEVVPLPVDAYISSRDQYDSSTILAKLRPVQGKSGANRLLGVTESDLCVPSMHFVFGEAHPLWGIAVVSLYRLQPGFYGQQDDVRLFLNRASKEAIHEVGHTLGLGHCDDPHCVMFFSNSIEDTDTKAADFCGRCRREMLESLRRPKPPVSLSSSR